jgi:Protein of unknown function (DUF5818)
MNRWSICSIGTLLMFSAVLVAAQSDRNPQLLTSDLVAWSSMQQPTAPEQNQTRQRPTPEPAPDTKPAQNPTAQPKAGQSSAASTASQGQDPTANTFTGTVSKEADGFTLRVSESTSYKLDNQQQVQQYEGRRVRVTGTLDPSINLIHVDKIEPIS